MGKNILRLPRLRKQKIHVVILTKTFGFYFFLLFLHGSYRVSLRKWVPEEAASHVRYRIFCTHFFDVAKKTSSEQRCIWYPYTSGSEKACEKSVKKVVRASSDLSVLYTIPLYKTCKIKRSLTVGEFGRHQNACFVHEIIRLPLGIFDFCFFSCFFDESREKPAPRFLHAYPVATRRRLWAGQISASYGQFHFLV